ncbi:Uncharacterized membrane protein [Nocardioides scoriae]|uniref:Uncharacterized membrane protein n=1 Tax=Nocardioides scoriae TaxID=642780 RepID=A0A1H1LKI7_9ACTN|nr:DUF2254 domain-containing protein [Nocardioides scoriae]SDR74947.1 Uncharacterized membrane protein [Nocardioides scoriae]
MSPWHRVRNAIRTQLWPLPVLAVLVAVAGGVLLPELDRSLDGGSGRWRDDVLFGGDADAARTLLDAISSSLITVTSLTFSLTVVTLQLASSQFSPRLLRTFTRDRFVQLTLALFLATFAFSLTAMRSVRNGDDSGGQFVPRLSVTVALVMALASVLGLVLFLAHLTREIRVETMLRNVHRDARATMEQLTSPRDSPAPSPAARLAARRATDIALLSASSGFLTRIDRQSLVDAASSNDAIVYITALPGSSLVQGMPIGHARFAAGSRPDAAACDAFAGEVTRAVRTGFERTEPEDLAYGLRQLTDVATKALSPGINDPTTAVHALSHASALLCELAHRELGPTTWHDESGALRAVVARPDLADLLELAVGQPRRYGASDLDVVKRLFGLLHELAHHVTSLSVPAVSNQLDRLRRTADQQPFDDVERAELQRLADIVTAALA